MKNTTILALVALVVIGVVTYMFVNDGPQTPITGSVIAGSGEVQKVTLGTKDLNYYPNEIRVKSGQPVSISLDNSVTGCLRSFTIKELGVSKYLRSVTDSLVFTPTQKGTFTFACSMGMGYGKLIVE
ncbi:MAG: cupredoxin domain-containing protein [Nanoarchaeota archaeon]